MKTKSLYINKKLLLSFFASAVFVVLMIFGLKHDSNFTPNQLFGKPVPQFDSYLFPAGKFNSHSILSDAESWKVINFWTSSCVVCRDEAPILQKFYKTMTLKNNNSLKFISVNIQDDFKTISNWHRDYELSYPIVMDKTGAISLDFGVTGTPETFLADDAGVVRYRIAGPVNMSLLLEFIDWLKFHPENNEADTSIAFKNLISKR